MKRNTISLYLSTLTLIVGLASLTTPAQAQHKGSKSRTTATGGQAGHAAGVTGNGGGWRSNQT